MQGIAPRVQIGSPSAPATPPNAGRKRLGNAPKSRVSNLSSTPLSVLSHSAMEAPGQVADPVRTTAPQLRAEPDRRPPEAPPCTTAAPRSYAAPHLRTGARAGPALGGPARPRPGASPPSIPATGTGAALRRHGLAGAVLRWRPPPHPHRVPDRGGSGNAAAHRELRIHALRMDQRPSALRRRPTVPPSLSPADRPTGERFGGASRPRSSRSTCPIQLWKRPAKSPTLSARRRRNSARSPPPPPTGGPGRARQPLQEALRVSPHLRTPGARAGPALGGPARLSRIPAPLGRVSRQRITGARATATWPGWRGFAKAPASSSPSSSRPRWIRRCRCASRTTHRTRSSNGRDHPLSGGAQLPLTLPIVVYGGTVRWRVPATIEPLYGPVDRSRLEGQLSCRYHVLDEFSGGRIRCPGAIWSPTWSKPCGPVRHGE